MVTNPLQYLTYIAGITQRVDLGTMVTVLPWHNPVRVAEDVNMLDAFLGAGREIICGVGRGLGRREYAGLGIDQAEARERFDESLQVLRQLLATGTCDFDGKHYQIHGLRLRPQPERDPLRQPVVRGRHGRDGRDHRAPQRRGRSASRPRASALSLETARKYARLSARSASAPSHTKLALWTYVADSESEARAAPSSTWSSTPTPRCATTSCAARTSPT